MRINAYASDDEETPDPLQFADVVIAKHMATGNEVVLWGKEWLEAIKVTGVGEKLNVATLEYHNEADLSLIREHVESVKTHCE